jgi:glycine/serine hydroxymethyltransferase
MTEREMEVVGELIVRALRTPDDDAALAMVKTEVEALCLKFPLYSERLA